MNEETLLASTVHRTTQPTSRDALGRVILHNNKEAARKAILEQLLALFRPEENLRMTYTEFLEWADEDTLAEWIALPGENNLGEVVMTSPASNRHQDISDFLTTILRIFVEVHKSGIVRSAPFQMKLEHGREPDLVFVTAEHLERIQETHLAGPADLAIEIISPESAARDRGKKFYEYAEGHVPEYWLIDYKMEWAEFYHLHGKRYHLAQEGHKGKYTSAVLPDFWLNIEWLWQDPLPPVLDIARTLGLIE